MRLTLQRTYRGESYTIGRLYVDGTYVCDTLEDKDRGLKKTWPIEQIRATKVYGLTAIPLGTYTVEMGIVSAKFASRSWAKPYGGKLPRLYGVPGFDGVLIHVGNYAGYETPYKEIPIPASLPTLDTEEYIQVI